MRWTCGSLGALDVADEPDLVEELPMLMGVGGNVAD